MLTPMALPDGTSTSMGDGIVPLEIVTVEIEQSDANRATLAVHIGKLQHNLLSHAALGIPDFTDLAFQQLKASSLSLDDPQPKLLLLLLHH